MNKQNEPLYFETTPDKYPVILQVIATRTLCLSPLIILTVRSWTFQILETQVQTLFCHACVSACSSFVNRFYVVQQPKNRVYHIRKDRSLSELMREGKVQEFHFSQTDNTQANNTGKGTQANGITVTYTVIRSLNRMNAYLMYNALGRSFC